jgi:putative phosphotransacetylase
MEDYTSVVGRVATLVMEQLQLLEEDPYQVPVGVSARHIHLEREHIDALFGPGYQLTPKKALSQKGQYASEETVEVLGPTRKPLKLRVLGPERKQTQVEVSLSDSRNLGMIPPVRTSGDIAGTPGIRIRGPKGEIEVKEGVIIPDRHIHMTPEVSEKAALDFHIDTDDANAFQLHQGQMVRIRKE